MWVSVPGGSNPSPCPFGDIGNKNEVLQSRWVPTGGPVGVETLAASLGEERDILEEVCEPYLLHAGFIARTPRGRVVTSSAYEHMGFPIPDVDQGRLL